MKRLPIIALLLCSCADSLPPGSVRPPDPPEMRAVDVTLAAWHAAGSPISEFAAEGLRKIVIVPRATDATVAQSCGVPACGGVDPPLPVLGCAYACTVWLDEAWPFNHGTPVVVISERVQNADRSVGEPVIHEMLHILAPSLLGGNDRMHADARLWRGRGNPDCVQTLARERYMAATP